MKLPIESLGLSVLRILRDFDSVTVPCMFFSSVFISISAIQAAEYKGWNFDWMQLSTYRGSTLEIVRRGLPVLVRLFCPFPSDSGAT
jgi:hypothetical protein